MSTRIYYVRHGQALSNLKMWYYDDKKEPLTELGRRQAEEAGRQLKELGIEFHEVFCSPYARALETARYALLAMGRDMAPITIAEWLGERKYEGLYGKSISPEDVRTLYDYNNDLSAQYGVETLAEVEARARKFINELRENYNKKNILIFAHGALGLSYRAVVEGVPKSGSLFDFNLLKNGEIMKLLVR